MAVNKIDPKKIFASQAPSQDVPAEFNNYERGWDESRKNNGKPTIKQFNKLQQLTDEKILWMHQNGAALPYDETMEYAEGAVVVKDGKLHQISSGVWSEYKSAVAGIQTFKTEAEALANTKDGDEFWVESEDDEVIAESFVNIGGVPTPSGKSYPSSNAKWRADQVIDESGRDLQEINDDVINAKSRGVINNGLNIRNDFLALVNSLEDGDEIFLPKNGGEYYWDATGGTLNVNKNISIRSDGAILRVKGYDGLSPFISFNAPVDITLSGADAFNSLNKNNPILDVKTITGITNPADYFVVLTSTEVAIDRPSQTEPYYKNITLDIVSNAWALRDPLPFSFTDLSKVTARFVKKQTPSYIGGFKIMPTEDHPQETYYFQASYKSRLTIDVMTVDCRGRQTGGALVHYNRCMGVVTKDSGCLGSNKPSTNSYVFQQSVSSYLQFIRCFYQDSDYSSKSANGIGGRHGFMNTYDSCQVNGVDDHWGYNGLVKNMHIANGIAWAGGGLTVEDTTSNESLIRLRVDTPYADGVLKIVRSDSKKCLFELQGHSVEDQIAGKFTKQKFWDVIDCDVDLFSSGRTLPPFLVREPNAVQTDVFRDTILKINCTYTQTSDNFTPLFEAYRQKNASGTDIEPFAGDIESKRVFGTVFMKIINTRQNDSGTHRHLLVNLLGKNITIDSDNISFAGLRGDEVTIKNASLNDTKLTTGSTFGCNILYLERFKFDGGDVYAPTAAKSAYPNMQVRLYDIEAQQQNIVYSKFTDLIKSCRGTFNAGQKIASGWDLSNYDRDFCATYTVPSGGIVVPANGTSVELSVSFANANYDSFVDPLFVFGDGSVVVDMVRKRSSGVEWNQYFKFRNTSGSDVAIPAGAVVRFKVR